MVKHDHTNHGGAPMSDFISFMMSLFGLSRDEIVLRGWDEPMDVP